jgi:two-component system, response regulator
MSQADILLVEDDPAHAELTQLALREDTRCSVHRVEDGEEALRYLSESRRELRLILLDLKLGKLDGFEVLRKIRSDVSTRHIPIVVLTSSQDERDIRMAYRWGVNSYVVKPVGFEEFRRVVSQVGSYWAGTNRPQFPGSSHQI